MTAAQCTPPHPYTHTHTGALAPLPIRPLLCAKPLVQALRGAGLSTKAGRARARGAAAPRAGMHEAHEHLLLDERWDGATAEHYAVAALLVLVIAVAGGAIVAYLVALSAVRRQKKGE